MTLAGWSATPLFLKYFTDPASDHYVDGWTSNGWRYGFAALLWLPTVLYFVFHKTKKLPKDALPPTGDSDAES